MNKTGLFYGFILILYTVIINCCNKDEQYDFLPPVCSISMPEDSSEFYIGDTIIIDVEAIDKYGSIQIVILYIDNVGKFLTKVPPYKFKWPTLNETTGFHTIRATAFDPGGNSSSDECVIKLVFGPPVVITAEVSSITNNSAISGGNITSDGGAYITAKGVCWATTAHPTINDSKTSDGSGTGSFTSYITGLTENTTYYVRAYARNSAGIAYGNNISFTTSTIAQGTFGEINDAAGDSQGPDLTYACISIKNNNMVLRVKFEQSTFDPQTTSAQFCLDTDCNPLTGHPGMNAGGVSDAGIIGVEYLVNIKHTSDNLQANVKKYKGTVNCFGFVSEVASTFVDNGMEVIVPCSLISNNNGILNFKLTTQTQLSENTYTGIKDYMTDLGQPVGEVR